MTVVINANKNIILLYSCLLYITNNNILKERLNNNLKIKKTIETHFNKFNLDINYKLKYHHSKAVAFTLTLDNNLNTKKIKNISKEMKEEIKKGKEI